MEPQDNHQIRRRACRRYRQLLSRPCAVSPGSHQRPFPTPGNCSPIWPLRELLQAGAFLPRPSHPPANLSSCSLSGSPKLFQATPQRVAGRLGGGLPGGLTVLPHLTRAAAGLPGVRLPPEPRAAALVPSSSPKQAWPVLETEEGPPEEVLGVPTRGLSPLPFRASSLLAWFFCLSLRATGAREPRQGQGL